MLSENLKRQWFDRSPRTELTTGIVVALALIPEAIAFSIIAGVDPKVGLYAASVIAMITAVLGGRVGMISAATGATALVMGPLVRDHGLAHLLAATMLAGLLQIAFGVSRLARYMRFVPRSVMVGYVNALAILLFTAQLPQFQGEAWPMFAMVAAGLVVIYLTPKRIGRFVPSTLIAIFALTAVAILGKVSVRRVGDMGVLPHELPSLAWPAVAASIETLRIVFPYAVTLALIGLLASLLCASILDERTGTTSNKDREACAQGVANISSALFGGMAGCAMIGQSMLNHRLGGRARLSSFVAGSLLMFLVVVLNKWVVQIPMAAIVAVMFMVSVSTMDWRSLRRLATMPRTEATAMVATVVTILSTRNFALGVGVGAVLSAFFFARAVSKHTLVRVESLEQGHTFRVSGALFYGSTSDLRKAFENLPHATDVQIDLAHAHIWDNTAADALDDIVKNLQITGTRVRLLNVNAASAELLRKQTQVVSAMMAA